MILSLFRYHADHPQNHVAVFVVYVFTLKRFFELWSLFKEKSGGVYPDISFSGYSPETMNRWYDLWEEDGRAAYVKCQNQDLFPFMPMYTLEIGSILILAARRAGWNEQIALLPVVVMFFDVFETLIGRKGAIIYPERLSDTAIVIASTCSILKWSFVVLSLLPIFISFWVRPKKTNTD